MGFKLSVSDSFFYPASVHTIQENGQSTKITIVFKFKRLDIDQVRDRQMADGAQIWANLMADHDGDLSLVNSKFTAELIRQGKNSMSSEQMADDLLEILCGWKDVSDDEGPMEFNRDNLVRLIRFTPGIYAAIKAAYNEANSGEGKRKN